MAPILYEYLKTLTDQEIAQLADFIGYRVSSLRTIASAKVDGDWTGVSLPLAVRLEEATAISRRHTNPVCAACPHADRGSA